MSNIDEYAGIELVSLSFCFSVGASQEIGRMERTSDVQTQNNWSIIDKPGAGGWVQWTRLEPNAFQLQGTDAL